ncbi:TraR/DksA C4-type zinc finger protein [Patescibacteria group bacterium]|nr:TraR/DksA C4-type zinc finger protein [Patescibacteria group bacterium]
MEPFIDKKRDGIRKILERNKTEVTKRMQELSAQDPYANPDRANDTSASDTEAGNEAGHDRAVALVEELTRQVSAIDAALLRIGDGSYGICTGCGRAISPERLAAMPTATLCVECGANKAA